MTNRYTSFSLAVIAAIVGFLLTFLFFDIVHALVFGVFILALYTITRRIWLPEGYGKNAVRLASIGVASALLVPTPLWVSLLQSNWDTIRSIVPLELPSPSLLNLSPLSVAAAALIVILVNRYMAERAPILATESKPFGGDFPIKSYNERLARVTGALTTVISSVDHEQHWSSEFYTPLEAEVEVRGEKKTVSTLLESIRNDKDARKFLVLGDPGSGKSVALRKLALDMLAETKRTGKLPLYIDLKEWSVTQRWSETHPPSVEELQEFIVDRISQKDLFVHQFFDEFFLPMFEHGRLFFLFDSFDEIPGVLDEEESSWLINELSQLFSQFIGGAHESRGVLASRQFRCPTGAYLPDKTLEIRPFSDAKIRDTLVRNSGIDERAITDLFRERPDWISIARNPFNASLLSAYFAHRNEMPQSQADLFEVYLSDRLSAKGCVAMMRKMAIDKHELIQFCVDVAFRLYGDSELGLEISKSRLSAELGFDVTSHFKILKFAFLARIAEDQDTVSFVHRRFTEYFISQYFVQHPEHLRLDVIPRDSSGRDGLVMYCETAPRDRAIEVSRFCWAEVSKLGELTPDQDEDAYRHAVLSLRFLTQAFRSRPECLDPFRDSFSDWISNRLDGPILTAKHALEATGLLQDRQLGVLVVPVIRKDDPWLTETAIRACRHLGTISISLQEALLRHLEMKSFSEIMSQKEELEFSFSLSQAFSLIKRFVKAKLVTERLNLVGQVLAFLINPPIYLLWYLVSYTLKYSGPEVFGYATFLRTDNLPSGGFGLLAIFLGMGLQSSLTPVGLLPGSAQLVVIAMSFGLLMPYEIIPLARSGLTIAQIRRIEIEVASPILGLIDPNWHADIVSVMGRTDWRVFARTAKRIAKTALSLGVVFAAAIALRALFRVLPPVVQVIIVLVGLALGSALGLVLVCVGAWAFLRHLINLRRVRRIEIPSSLTRTQIVEMLVAAHVGSRAQLLRKIADSVTHATGRWPGMDDLSREVRSELAKLDEKWIGLA